MHPINEHAGQSRLASASAGNLHSRNQDDVQSIDFMAVLTDGKGQQQKPSVSEAAPNPGQLPLAKPALHPSVDMAGGATTITKQDEDPVGIDIGRSLSMELTGNGKEAPALLVRLYEQHAIANPFLSIISPGQDSTAEEALGQSEATERIPPSKQSPESARSSFTDASPRDAAFGPEPAATTSTAYALAGDDLPEHDWSAPLIGSVAAESQLWLQRLAKVTTSSEGKATLWIRDYRAPIADSAEAIESFRSYAREQGLDIHRIVMNGVEIWRYNAVQGDV